MEVGITRWKLEYGGRLPALLPHDLTACTQIQHVYKIHQLFELRINLFLHLQSQLADPVPQLQMPSVSVTSGSLAALLRQENLLEGEKEGPFYKETVLDLTWL